VHDGAVPAFVPGLELSRAYYDEVVRNLVGDVPHAAGRLGWGSDVLGFDSERSTDHGWGPRVQVFVEHAAITPVRERVHAALPATFRGWPTTYGWDDTAARPWVEITTVGAFLVDHFGFDPRREPSTVDWLVMPQQLLLGVTSGAVFQDPDGALAALRRTLRSWPDDVWHWLLACQWQRIAQEEPFVGRTAEAGDDLGSRLVTARLARDVVRLCFLLERRYAPYSKWLGTAFATLDAAAEIQPHLTDAVDAVDVAAREAAFVAALESAARRHNALGIGSPVEPTTRAFHGRPSRVIGAERFVASALGAVRDERLLALPLVGAIDQWSDSTDVLSHPSALRRARAFYDA
jgi:hypothetical protein